MTITSISNQTTSQKNRVKKQQISHKRFQKLPEVVFRTSKKSPWTFTEVSFPTAYISCITHFVSVVVKVAGLSVKTLSSLIIIQSMLKEFELETA